MPTTSAHNRENHWDILFTNACIIDGQGHEGYSANLAIQDGIIVYIGSQPQQAAKQVIDAQGLVLAPGFIDSHTHDDWALLETPQMPCKISQGVTTVVTGNCGISAVPFLPIDELPDPFNLIPGMAKHGFQDVPAYCQALAEAQPAVNTRMLVGHSSLRAMVMGADIERAATEEEIMAMAALLDQALTDGAAGLSSGLDYAAALSAETDELVTLAEIVAKHEHKVYTTHIRDEGDQVIASVEEALSTARQATAPLILSHHKCAGKANFGKSQTTLKMIDEARRKQSVALDVYPYTASSTCLSQRFLDSADDILVTWSAPYPQHNGTMLDDIAQQWGITREQACERLLPAGAIYFDMHKDDLERIMQHPLAMIGSDGLPGTPNPHPRLWGTFPRVLGHYVREQQLLSLSQAIHKMTGLSASQFGIQDRGIIDLGKAADLVLFDANSITDLADFENPEVACKGIHHVLVNGQFALHSGQLRDCHAGQFLAH